MERQHQAEYTHAESCISVSSFQYYVCRAAAVKYRVLDSASCLVIPYAARRRRQRIDVAAHTRRRGKVLGTLPYGDCALTKFVGNMSTGILV